MLKVAMSVSAVAMLAVTSVAPRARHSLSAVRDSVAEERTYASAVATIADSAIHRLDFFPARAQLRIQTAFVAPTRDAIPFDDLAARGSSAAIEIDAAVERLAGVTVPGDLTRLNAQLVAALNDATRAAASLTTAAHACQLSMASVERCQVPFSSASSRVAESYKRYLKTRALIRSQVLDTDTHLAEFTAR